MREVDPARERMDVIVLLALHVIEAVPASEHEVGPREQLLFAQGNCRVGAMKGRELVHAVIDDLPRLDMGGKGQCLWRIVPKNRIVDRLCPDKRVKQLPLSLDGRRHAGPVRQERGQDRDALGRHDALQRRRFRINEQRLFPIEHASVAGCPPHEVLRSLEDKGPAQVRKADQWWAGRNPGQRVPRPEVAGSGALLAHSHSTFSDLSAAAPNTLVGDSTEY